MSMEQWIDTLKWNESDGIRAIEIEKDADGYKASFFTWFDEVITLYGIKSGSVKKVERKRTDG